MTSESGGILDIHAGPTPAADVSSIWGYHSTSGIISTTRSFQQQYGYFEAGMKLPASQGNWPAFWLYVVDHNSELDVMEQQNGSNRITARRTITAQAGPRPASQIPSRLR